MLRVLTASGLTANSYLAQPNVGYKWIILSAQIVLTTGTGTGSRSAALNVVGKGSLINYPLLATTSGSSASAVYEGTGGTAGALTSPTNTSWNAFPEIRAVDQIGCLVSLVSGDTVAYYVLVDEVLDE